MAPTRRKGKAAASRPPSRRRTRSTANGGEPNIYDEMVAEAAARDDQSPLDDRPLKRRRVAILDAEPPASKQDETESDGGLRPTDPTKRPNPKSQQRHTQTVDASDSDESDFDFEDVDLNQSEIGGEEHESSIQDVSISVGSSTTPTKRTPVRRKAATAAEKAYRILVHKAHLLCLLGHCMFVNTWCNDAEVQTNLRHVLDDGTVSNLTLGPNKSQFERNRWFLHGLESAVELFKVAFKVSASGVRKAKWPVDGEDPSTDTDMEPVGRTELIRAAKAMSGSQDAGNQLFCALLRLIGVRARLVCSLQVLPFASVASKGVTPQKPMKPVVFASAPGYTSDGSAKTGPEDSSVSTSKRIGKIPSVRRRLGQPAFSFASPTTPSAATHIQKRTVHKLAYPVFWVEAFNTSHQKWIAVDPIVTHTVNKPAKLEPPGSYDANQLTYTVGFEADGVARDVTRRYAKAFNAKTRQQRVESLEGGLQWWKQALRLFRGRGTKRDSDQVEDAELAQKEAQEGMPSNVQDFKHHPYYALERHLRRHEVIHPRKSVGRANLGSNANPKMEAVFRRQDVLVCRSADKWYRLGREIKKSELPLKHITTRTRIKDGDEPEEESSKTTALYAAFQTELYVPPPVVKGKVPRNGFGNLDVYVPSMVPAGGTHVRHELARQAAQTLKIDCADAVTGFSFKGRHGTAIIEGVVVASKYADAISAVIEGMEHKQQEEASMKRSLLALQLWQRLLTGLRIRERVSEYGELSKQEDGEEVSVESVHMHLSDFNGDPEAELITAGKFSLTELKSSTTPKKRKQKQRYDSDEDDYDSDDDDEDEENHSGGGFIMNEEQGSFEHGGGLIPDLAQPGGFMPEDGGERGFLPDATASTPSDRDGGGFIPDGPDAHDDNGAGGFIADDEDDADGIVLDRNAHGERSGNIQDTDTQSPTDGVLEMDRLSDEPGTRTSEESSAAPSGRNEDESKLVVHAEKADTRHVGHSPTGEQDKHDALEEADGPAPPSIDEDKGTDTDRGSLLSHDPEDDDAEPDWLESD